MTTLVLLAHADPSVRPLYERALRALPGSPCVVRPFVSRHPGMSAAYDREAAELRSGGRILPGLLARYAQGVACDRVVLAWWSGGYALARAVLRSDEDAAAIDACVALDGMHGPTLSPALDDALEPFARYARRAADGACVLHVGHSDVRTPTYASTTQCAERLVELVGPPRGGWRVDAFDVARDPVAEHVAALRSWGPEYVASAVAALPVEAPRPAPSVSRRALALEALRLAQAELAAGVREATGRNDGAPIARYFTGARRRSPQTGLEVATGWAAGWEWCAAAASWCVWTQAHAEAVAPHGWRIAVHELVTDARASGAWRPAGSGYVPQPGDLCILSRAGGDPTRGGLGHVGRVESVDVDGGEVVTIDGNAGVAWGRARRRLGDPSIVGWISYDDEGLVPDVVELVRAAMGRAREWLAPGVA